MTNQLTLFNKDYFKAAGKITPAQDVRLEELRNLRALRIPKNIVNQIVAHDNFIDLCYYLALKPLFVSGSIHAADNKLPYQKIAEFLKISESNTRKIIKNLKTLNLCYIDKKKNIILRGYKQFCSLFECSNKTHKHKYYTFNNTDIQTFIKSIALAENLKKQKYEIKNKLAYFYNKLSHCELIKGKTAQYDDILINYITDKQSFDKKKFRRKLKKGKQFVNQHYEELINNYQIRFDKEFKSITTQISGLLYKRVFLDPDLSLSCQGVATLLNRSSKSTGHYQQNKMYNAGFIDIISRHIFSDDFSTIYEIQQGIRQDSFINKFPKKTDCQLINRYVIKLNNSFQLNFQLM